MKFSLEKKIIFFFLLAAIALVSVLVIFYYNTQKIKSTSDLVEHTQEVLRKSDDVLMDVLNIETGSRGYSLTGNELYLDPYNNAIITTNSNIEKLALLTKDNPNQQSRMDSLKKVVEERLAFTKNSIAARKQNRLNDSEKIMSDGNGKILTDKIRSIIADINSEEFRLLEQRKKTVEKDTQNFALIFLALFTIILIILITVYVIITSNLRVRKKAEDELHQLNKELVFKNEEKEKRAAELIIANKELSFQNEEKEKRAIELIIANKELKKAEQAIKKSEEKYRSLIEQASDAIFIYNAEGKFLDVNERACTMLDYTKEQLCTMKPSDLFTADELSQKPIMQKELLRGERTSVERNILRSNGSLIPVDITAKMLSDGRTMAIVRDISERKQAEQAIKESEEKYRTLVEQASDAILITDTAGQFITVNTSACKLSQYSEKELLEMTIYDFAITEDLQKNPFHFDELKQGKTVINERAMKRNNGIGLNVETTSKLLPDGRLLIFVRDISERKKTEEALEKRAAELLASNTELEHFAYVASHDLQEPLRMVISFMNLLEKRMDGQLDETNKQYIHFAVDGAKRMKTLIQDLLLYSRVGTNKENFTATDLNEVMQYVNNLLKENIKKTRAEITVKPMPVISANKPLISQLFVNLVSNALKYHGDKEPEIEVGCTEEPGKWIFYVKDNGIGIDPKYFDKIFIMFQRLHNKNEYSGTGIGLAICKKIVETHKGKIWVESEAGKGSTFYFSLPKHTI